MSDHIQAQQIYPDIDPKDEHAMFKVIELAKQVQRKTIELEERIEALERSVDIKLVK